MKVSYYPGCTLRNKAKDLDRYARACAKILGFELCEIPEWQCCGGSYTDDVYELATKLAAVRALKAARDAGEPLVTVCSACHNVIKRTNLMMKNEFDAARVNAYMAQDKNAGGDYHGETAVYHYLEYLRDVVGFDKVREAVVNPLTGKKIGAYYGCLLLRPSAALAMDDPENPRIIEDLIRALGAEPVIYAQRNECCGGYLTVKEPEAAKKQSLRILEDAAAHEAELLVTACPLCRYNLNRAGTDVPVVYFTELLAEALGVKEADV